MIATISTARSAPCEGPRKLPKFKQQLFDLVVGAQRNGTQNMTRKELQQAWEHRHSKRTGDGNVSGRVSEMVRDGYLVELGDKRQCRVTTELAKVFFVPAQQASLV